jgi:hypothetical protein
MLKKHMVPLSAKGKTTKHQGKGSQMASMPSRSDIDQLAQPGSGMNDYAKVSPASAPAGAPAPVGVNDLDG